MTCVKIQSLDTDPFRTQKIDSEKFAGMVRLHVPDIIDLYILYHKGEIIIMDKQSAETYWTEKEIQNNRVTSQTAKESLLARFTFDDALARINSAVKDGHLLDIVTSSKGIQPTSEYFCYK
jgi:hypothetical protein